VASSILNILLLILLLLAGRGGKGERGRSSDDGLICGRGIDFTSLAGRGGEGSGDVNLLFCNSEGLKRGLWVLRQAVLLRRLSPIRGRCGEAVGRASPASLAMNHPLLALFASFNARQQWC